MSEPAHHLRLIDSETGEVLPDDGTCPNCISNRSALERAEQDIENLESELRGKRQQIKSLKTDREKQARNHPRRVEVEELWDYWRTRCNHPRSKLDADRTFRLAWGIETFGMEVCKLAIDGAAFDPWTRRRANGTLKRFDDVDLIFRNAANVEDFCNRAPKDRQAAVRPPTQPEGDRPVLGESIQPVEAA